MAKTFKSCLNCNSSFQLSSKNEKQIFCSRECYRKKAKLFAPKFVMTEERRKNMRASHLGKASGNKGKTGYKSKFKGVKRPELSGSKCHLWNGGKPKCLICNTQIGYKSKYCVLHSNQLKGGKNHWNWKGGITPNDRKERLKFKKQIQLRVFERDNYTCQLCGIKGKDLQVDHIQPWADYIELRFDINNCRTLCAKCHYKITFGKPMPPTVRAWGHNLLGGANL